MSAPLFDDSDSVGFELHRIASCTISPLIDHVPDHDLDQEQRASIEMLIGEASSMLKLAADIATASATPLSDQASRGLYLILEEIEDQARGTNISDATNTDVYATVGLIDSAVRRLNLEA
jgi:hypothetical protein